MSSVRDVAPGRSPGATRTCPHCRATILESETVCPACRHHLRAGRATARAPVPATVLFRVTGTVGNPHPADAIEYSVLLVVSDERGAEVSRQVMGVGALRAEESRTFTLDVRARPPG
ncbi:MAG TPA: hypothetical protein VG916_11375 [Gemmatimonadaceae bacterium]|nr:hypothetical protein [Gemmatimonadaceae bacterium]